MGDGGSYFERWQSKADGKWYYHLVGGNHEITGPSEGYDDKYGVTEGIRNHVNGVLSAIEQAGTLEIQEGAAEVQIDIRDRRDETEPTPEEA